MSGSGLVRFVIDLIALLAAGGIFFISIDRVAPDEFFARVAKIAIGALLLIALVVAIAAVFGMASGVAVSPLGVVWFAIAVIIAVALLYVINLVFAWIATNMGGGPWVTPVKYVLGVIVLVGLLVAAANLLFGYKMSGLTRSESQFPPIGAVTPGPPDIITANGRVKSIEKNIR